MSDCKLPRNFVAEHIDILPKSGIRKFFDIVSTMKDVISLSVGEPDFVSPWTIRESALFSLEKGRTSYTSNLGTLSLRKAVCDYLAKDYALEYDPKTECLITVGVSEALDLVIRAITSPGDEIIFHQPCYVSYVPEIRMAHGIPVPVDTYEKNAFALDPADLEAAITPKTKAILLNFPCNPTGAVLTEEQTRRIAEIAEKHDLLVIADDIYSELTYGKMTPSIATMPGMRERTIVLHGFSKAFAMTGFRIGYACGPQKVIDAMMKIHQYTMLCASITAQDAAEEALKNGKSSMTAMRAEYQDRRNVIVKGFNDIGLPCLKPSGAFYVFPNITSTGMSSADFALELLKRKNVAVVPGDAFGDCGSGYIRCSYATSIEGIREALKRIGEFVREIKAEQAAKQ